MWPNFLTISSGVRPILCHWAMRRTDTPVPAMHGLPPRISGSREIMSPIPVTVAIDFEYTAPLQVAKADQLHSRRAHRLQHARRRQRVQFSLTALLQPRSRGPQFVRAEPGVAHELGRTVGQPG